MDDRYRISGKLTVVIFGQNRDRAIAIVDALTATGDVDAHVIGSVSDHAKQIARHNPDIVLIDIDSPSRRTCLYLPPEVIDRALMGTFAVSMRGEQRHVPGFVEFLDGAATFPWRSQAKWIVHRMAARYGLDPPLAQSRAVSVFGSDLCRRALQGTGAGRSDRRRLGAGRKGPN